MDTRSVLCFTVVLLAVLCTCHSQSIIQYRILEEIPPNSFVGNVVSDAELDKKFGQSVRSTFKFRFLQGTQERSQYFSLEESTGILHTAKRIDRDRLRCSKSVKCSIDLDVTVYKPAQHFQIIKVNVEILDINDHAPKFPQARVGLSIMEEFATPGVRFTLPLASDLDSPENSIGKRGYELSTNTRKFKLEESNNDDGSKDLHLILTEKLDREQEHSYQLKILAFDNAVPSLTGSLTVDIKVVDINDNSPVFENRSYEAEILENTPQHTTIIQVKATDRDEGPNGQIAYKFAGPTVSKYGDLFAVNETSGEIWLKKRLDYRLGGTYVLTVIAQDKGAGSVPKRAKVNIKVVDINDHPPHIKVNTLNAAGYAEVSEASNIGDFVAHISVKDNDGGRNGQFNCSLLRNFHFSLQQMYAKEFKIVTRTMLDREKRMHYETTLKCTDHGTPPKTSERLIKVRVLDENDHAPLFSQQEYTAELKENNEVGLFIVQVNATDKDEGKNAEIHYKLQRDPLNAFTVDPKTGVIATHVVFDRERMDRVKVYVVAFDAGSPPKSSTAVVIVNIEDANDERPLFSQPSYTFGTFENQLVGTEVGTLTARDADSKLFSKFSYSFAPAAMNMVNTFNLNAQNGKITLKRVLDREVQYTYHFAVVAKDAEIPTLSSTANVTVYVADKNDNGPVIKFPNEFNNTVYLSSMAPVGFVVGCVDASDEDIGSNALLKYSFTQLSDYEQNMFAIDQNTGVVTVNSDLRQYDYKAFRMVVVVKDHGYPQKTSAASLNIVVNKSIAFYGQQEQNILSGQHFTIVVSLAGASGFLLVILVVIIVIVKRQGPVTPRNGGHKYITQSKIWNLSESEMRAESESLTEKRDFPDGHCSSPARDVPVEKQVTFNLENNERPQNGGENIGTGHPETQVPNSDHDQAGRGVSPTPINGAPVQHAMIPPLPPAIPPRPNSYQVMANQVPRHRIIFNPAFGLPGQPMTEKELKVHQWLSAAHRDRDTDSLGSADVSNSDSGRGASEEGDSYPRLEDPPHGQQQKDVLSPVKEVESPQPVHNANMDPSLQNHGSQPGYHGNQPVYPGNQPPYGGPRDSMGNPLVPGRRKFVPPMRQPDFGNNNHVGPQQQCANSNPRQTYPYQQPYGYHGHPGSFRGNKHCRPVPIPVPVPLPKQIPNVVSNLPNVRTCPQRNSHGEESDDGTTTSGSYVVDGEDEVLDLSDHELNEHIVV